MTALLTDTEHERIFNKYYGNRTWMKCCTDCFRPLRTRAGVHYCPACENERPAFLDAASNA